MLIRTLIILTLTNPWQMSFAQVLSIPKDFQATFDVYRDGKKSAQQTTTFKQIGNNQYVLSDVTKGTHGLAALTGFNRNERTEFRVDGTKITEIKHDMKQKVAFSKRSFRFKTQPDKITGKAKKTFQIPSSTKPISAHLLPLWLGQQACNYAKSISVAVLKSDKIRNYQFKVFEEPAYYRVERIYPQGKNRTTHIWFDKNNDCLPQKTFYQENDEPSVTTQRIKLSMHNETSRI